MFFDKSKINDQKKGPFGEYIYREFAKSKKFEVYLTNIADTDVKLKLNEKEYEVDVKTTEIDSGGYKGVRHRQDILYEQVVLTNSYAKINPDNNSPFKKYDKKDLIINNIDELFKRWKNSEYVKKPINSYQNFRNKIKKKINNLFIKKNINIRVVCRGSVSLTRWSSWPDNLPGTKKTINKYPATVFVQFIYKNNQNEKISDIFYINHKDLGKKIKLIEPNNRQKNKGINKVINFEAFKIDIPELIFKNLAELESFVKKL
jgi:hypothetical protein